MALPPVVGPLLTQVDVAVTGFYLAAAEQDCRGRGHALSGRW